jgi:ATP-dependent protease HslVU (ClpYQ) peptidase subunit
MTTIIATVGNNTASLTADRGITSDLIHPDMPKIVQQDSWLIGVAGNARVCDLLQYAIEYPKPPQELVLQSQDEWYGWIVTKIIPLIDDTIKDSEMEAEALLVTHGKAFLISENLSVLSASPYWAIGSGAEISLGVLATSVYNPDWNKNHDLSGRRAGQVASMHDPNTRGTLDQYISSATGKSWRSMPASQNA